MTISLSKSVLALRAQDFHEGLRDVSTYGPKEAHLQTTILIGKAASLVTHLKGLDFVDNVDGRLMYLAAELGISGIELRPVLTVLEDVDFASVIGPGTQIRRLELRIPELRNSYEDLGEKWIQLGTTEIERAAISTLESVASMPTKELEMQASIGIAAADFNTILAIGTAGALLDRHVLPSGEILLYSPLTVEEHPEAFLELASKFPEQRVASTLTALKKQQGTPIDKLVGVDKNVILEAVLLGVLCPVRISSGETEHTFLFSPRGGLAREERIILEKARAVLACVRCGEHYADFKPVLYPRSLLEALREKKTFRHSRPDTPEQYALLAKKGIGRIEEDTHRTGFYYFHLHDTRENMRALDIAIDLLDIGTTSTTKLEVDARQYLGVGGSFSGTLPTRTRLSRTVQRTKEMDRTIISEIAKVLRGTEV